jgi:hypothetical protein
MYDELFCEGVTGYGSSASALLASQVEVQLPLTQCFVVRDRRKWIRIGWIHSGVTEVYICVRCAGVVIGTECPPY